MPTQQLPILSPIKGVVRAVPREGQPPDTCWDALNIVPYDRYGRKRLSQRGGLRQQIVSVDGVPTTVLNPSGTKIQGMIECPVLAFGAEGKAIGVLTDMNSGNPFYPFNVTSTGGTTGSSSTGTFTHSYPTAPLSDTYDWQFTFLANLTLTTSNPGIWHNNGVGSGTLPDAGYDAKMIFYFPYSGSVAANTLIVVFGVTWTSNNNMTSATMTCAVDFWMGDPGGSASTWSQVNPLIARPSFSKNQVLGTGLLYDFTIPGELQLFPVTGKFELDMPGFTPSSFKGNLPFAFPPGIWPNMEILRVEYPGMDFFTGTGGPYSMSMNFGLLDRGTAISASPNAPAVPSTNSPLVAANDGLVYVGDTAGNFVTAGGQGGAFPGTPLLHRKTLIDMAFLSAGANGPAVYMVDGENIAFYSLTTGSMTPYTASTGTAPTNCSLCCNWRGRLVLAGDSLNPQNFYMSRSGEPTDWDYSQLDPAAAVAGNLSTAGRIGEPIVSLIPFSDDYMMVGCLNSLWMLQGDPADGGTIVNVSNTMGFTAPHAWCVDPDGTLYFIARGGLYSVKPAWEFYRPPELLSGQTYDQYFQTIINGQFYLSMQWDVDNKYLHIFATAVNTENTGTHMIYDARNGGLWPQFYPHNYSPVVSTKYLANSVNGLPSILLGGYDSSIRVWTPTQLNDDGIAISSYAVLGPVRADPEASLLSGVTINMGETLASDVAANWNATATLASGPDAYSVTEGTPHSSAVIAIPLDRRQKTFRQRFRGGWFSLTLANSTINTYFSFESALLEFMGAGRNRERR